MVRRPITRSLIGSVVREFRLREGLTQEALSARAKLHRTYISQVELGMRNPTLESLDRILLACGVGWAEFGARLDQDGGE
jgi:transcriptional regulator with XRE-family HTH domain